MKQPNSAGQAGFPARKWRSRRSGDFLGSEGGILIEKISGKPINELRESKRYTYLLEKEHEMSETIKFFKKTKSNQLTS